MFGLEANTIREIKKVINQVPGIEKVILYGSRAKGNYKMGSDIDISLVGESLTWDNSVYPLMKKLEELYIPYKFDISIFKDLDNKDLIDHISRVGKILYQRKV